MARLNESPAPPNTSQSAKKPQVALNGSIGSFLSSPAKPSGSLSPHPNKRIKSLAPTGTPRSDASRSHSPPSQRNSPHIPVSSPSRKALSDTAGDDIVAADRNAPADTVSAAAPAQPEEATTPTVDTTTTGATLDTEAGASTPEPGVPRTNVLNSVRKTISSAVNNFTGQRSGTTTITSTFEQTIVSRKRSREPETEAEETPAPAEKEAERKTEKEAEKEDEVTNGTADANDTTIQLGNQFEAEVAAEEVRAKSPVKEAVQAASPPAPPADDAEINVATASDNADTVQAASTDTGAVVTAGEEDVEMDDPKNGVFVLDKIIAHRRDPNDKTLFQMRVNWKHGDPTWEPEQTIQEDAEEALFAYWASVKGGRLGAMADKNLWHVLKVEKHRQRPTGAVQLSVYWIGSPDRSWEPESQVEQYARQHVEDYWKSKGGREKHIKVAAAPTKRGRGRPRKNPVPETEEEIPQEGAHKATKEVLKEAPSAASLEIAKDVKEKRGRPGRKQKRDELEAEEAEADKAEKTEKATEAAAAPEKAEPAAAKETVVADEEPPKKRGRGRPRKNPVS